MKREIKIGIFTILAIVGMWGGLRFLSGVNFFDSYKTYYAKYEQASGLQNASAIYVRGVKVGNVTSISLDTKDATGVIVKMSVERNVKIPNDSRALLSSESLMSSKSIEIILGESDAMLKAGDMIQAEVNPDIIQAASSQFEDLSANLESITTQLSQTLVLVNELLASNSQLINSSLTNINALSQNANKLIEPENGSISQMADNLADITTQLNGSVSKVDSLLENLSSVSKDLDDAEIGTSLNETLEGLNKITTQINSKQGTAGKILYDEELYSNLTAAANSLDSLFIDIKESPSRYVSFSVFGSSKKAQKKAEKAEKAQAEAQEKAQEKAAKGK